MFTLRPRTDAVCRALLIAIIMLNAVAPSLALAQSSATPTVEPSATPTQTETATPTTEITGTPTETMIPTVTETPVPVTETATPTGTLALTNTASSTQTVITPVTSPTVQIPNLILTADPSFVTPSGNIILTWTIEGIALDGLTLQVHIPDGISLQDENPGAYDEASRTLSLVPTSSTGELLLRANQTISGISVDAVLMRNDETLASASLFIPAHEQFLVDPRGGKITAKHGKLKLEVPEGVFSEEAVIEIGDPSGDAIPPYSLRGQPFEITAHAKTSGEDLEHFPKELSIFVSYADLGIPEQQEGDLALFWYDPASGEWQELPSMVNTKTKTLEALTDHFTVFDMDINNWQANHTPTIDSFQVSNFTGSATYSYPIEVPAGPGGFQPSVELNYNSQVVDQSTTLSQTSWVGMGWSLDSGSIELDTHGTSWLGDDTYMLNVAGISTRLLPYGGTYHAVDENFWKITNVTSPSSWTVQDKQGNTYYFTYVLSYPYQTGSCSGGTAEINWNGYKWMLTKVKNIFGQEILYDYFDQLIDVRLQQYYSASETCGPVHEYPIAASYPETITYANGKYRIRFDVGQNFNNTPSRWDMPSYWSSSFVTSFQTYERYRLQNIYVEQDMQGTVGDFETLIGKYQLTYAADTAPDIIFPGFTWAAGGKTSTLKSIRQYGADGISFLPDVTFTYGDNLHLTKADNGYGGTVEFDYDDEPWYYQNYAPKSHTTLTKFGLSNQPCEYDDEGNWGVHITGSYVACPSTGGSLRVKGTGHASRTGLPYRPGGVYKVSASFYNDPGVLAKIGIYDGISDYLSLDFNATSYVYIVPATATTVEPLVYATGGGVNTWAHFSTYKFEQLTSIYRVTTKKTSDGNISNPHTYTYTYTYEGPAVNDAAHSAGVCDFDVNNYGEIIDTAGCYEFYEKFSEFRGHSQVTEKGPDGTKTVTAFNQDDVKKGRPTSVTKNDGAADLSRVDYTYTSTTLPAGKPYPGNGLTYIGIDRYWLYTDSQTQNIFGSTSGKSKTTYTYEPTYGNLTAQTDQTWNGSAWVTYRTTATDYFPNTATYLVGFPALQQIMNSGGTVLAETLNLYDGANTYTTAPTTGKLTATRTWTSLANYSQVSYGYDTWGNRTTVTTYTGYGTASTAPTAGPATTTTTYDTTYHIYPISVTNALSQTTNWTYDYALGVPLTESDPNDSPTNDTTITAEYDAFGRIKTLIRPGDDLLSPTLQITYNDINASSPVAFTTTITQKIDGTQSYSVQKVYDGMGRQTKITSGGISVDTSYPTANVTQQSVPYTGASPDGYTTTTIDPAAHTTVVSAPDGTSTITQTDGLTSTVMDARGNSTISTSDIWGRVVSVTPPTGPSLTYAYDELSHLVKATRRGTATISPSETNPGTNGLVSWWSMDETSGTRNDSYFTHHLTDINTVAGANGVRGNSADFEKNNSEYLRRDLDTNLQMSTSDIYVGAWIKAEDSLVSYPNVISKLGTDGGREFNLRVSSSGVVEFIVYDGLNTSVTKASTTATINDGEWYYVEGWTDKINRTVYVNINNGTPASAAWTAGTTRNGAGSSPLLIGARAGLDEGIGEYWDGMIDEVVYYKRSLTAGERTWLYHNGSGRAFANSPVANPGTSGLISWWSMDETSGTRNDSMNKNPLSNHNSVGFELGKQGSVAAKFATASSNYLSVNDNSTLSTGDVDISLCAWVKLTDNNSNMAIAGKYNGSTNQREYLLYYVASTNRFRFIVSSNGSNEVIVSADSFGAPALKTWYLVCGWHDSITNTINIQVNNGTIDSVSHTAGIFDGTAPFQVGMFDYVYLQGSIDEVALYKRVLTPDERTWLYNNGNGQSFSALAVSPGTTNLVSWWSMDETGGPRNDSNNLHNDLTDNSVVQSTLGKRGNAAKFVGASQFLSVADNTSISGGNVDFTLAAYVYLNNTTNTFIIANKADNVTNFDYRLMYHSGMSAFRFRVGPNSVPIAVDSEPIQADTWYFIVAWHDSVNDTINIQINNGAVKTASFSGGTVDTTNPLTIGALGDGTSGLNGHIDEFAFYKRVLTSAERSWLYNNGAGRSYAEISPSSSSTTVTTTTTMSYDKAGRKITMSDPDMGDWSYAYDALGNLTAQTDAKMCTINLTYDVLSRLSAKSYTDTDCPSTPTVNYYYDGQSFTFSGTVYNTYTNGLGRRTGMMVNGSNANVWNYDTRGRVTKETVNTGTAYDTQWVYNAADLPTIMYYPDGEGIGYSYNNRMLLNSVIGSNAYVSSTTYDPAGRITSRVLGDGQNSQTQNYKYFAWNTAGGRLEKMVTGSGSWDPTAFSFANNLQSSAYEYDAVGNISQITAVSASANETNSYDYDALNRLTVWRLNDDPETYSYDGASGNLSNKAGIDLAYAFQVTGCQAGSRTIPHAVSSSNNNTNTYEYDCNGNQIKYKLDQKDYALTYDAENRLVSAVSVSDSSLNASFVYDGDGRRVQSTINTGTPTVITTFVGTHYEKVSGGAVTKYYFAGTQRVAMRINATLYYLLGDHLGSTSMTVNASTGETVETRYKPWGEVRYTTSNRTLPTRYTYTGQYSYMNDDATDLGSAGFGLMFYNARFYSPYINHFIQPDTMVPNAADPQSWSRYAYVSNNPLRYTDPTGHMVADDDDGGVSSTGCLPSELACQIGQTERYNTYKEKQTQKAEPIDQSESYPGGYCWDYTDLVGCTQDGMPLFMGEEPLEINPTDFEEMTTYLMWTAHEDTKWDLAVNAWRFDTPFYDHSFYGLGKLSGTGCINGTCYARHELNYVAQGVLWARVGVSKSLGHGIVKTWKVLPIGHWSGLPSDKTLEMFDSGYDGYMEVYPP